MAAVRPPELPTSERFFGGFVPLGLPRHPALARGGRERTGRLPRAPPSPTCPSTPSFRYWPGTGGGISYSKTALWLHTLERQLGWPTLQRILSTFFERWKFRHPRPDDFFAVVNEVSGRDLTWFFDQVHRSSNVFDYGVDQLDSAPVRPATRARRSRRRRDGFARRRRSRRRPFRTTVVVRRYGEAVFPVDVLVTFEDGEQGARALGRPRPVDSSTPTSGRRARVSAEVDPDRVLLLDVNYTNNSRTLAPAGRARRASGCGTG